MARRTIVQEGFSFAASSKGSDLDELVVIDWSEADTLMAPISAAAKGEQGWPPLCLFKALVLGRWYDLSGISYFTSSDHPVRFYQAFSMI